MISKEQALNLLHENLKNEALRRHCLASSVVMKAAAEKLGKPAREWEVIGLLHDIDLDHTRDDMQRHAQMAVEMLADADIRDEYLHAIVSHNEGTGVKRETIVDHALAACESITGLITACAMVYPDRRISSVKPKSIKKRMKEKGFARSVSRANILECEKAGIPFDDFVVMALGAMAPIETELIDYD
jgi:putative nucleotidyltransferase with HDIG domain